MTLPTLQLFKLALAAFGIGLVWVVHRSAGTGRRRDLAIVVVAMLSSAAYLDFGQYPKFGRFANPHDLFHYYLGSKYSREVGYRDLYPAVAIAAADEHDRRRQHRTLRRMQDYQMEPVERSLERAEQIRARFGERRWQELRRDVRVFQDLLGYRFGGVLKDMGYNATPVWSSFARVVTNVVPARSAGWLAAIDLLLVALTTWVLTRAFDLRVAGLWLIAFGTSFCMSYTHIRGAFLRLDWMLALVLAVAAIHTRWFRTAGVLIGWAAMSRVFPAIFLVGLGGWAFWRWREDGRVPRLLVHVAGAFLVTCAVLLLFTVWDDGGLQVWRAFFRKITLHNNHLAPIRVGFKYLFLGLTSFPDGNWWLVRGSKAALFRELAPLWWAIQALVVGVTVWAMRRRAPHEALALGYVPVFFLVAPTFYYHVVTLVPMLALLSRLRDRRHAWAASCLFGVSILLYVVNQFVLLGPELAFTMSCLLLGICAVLLWVAWAPPAPEEHSES